jgi:SAM-dependent methyltransferase
LPDDLVVGDLGCGTGAVAAELAQYAGRVVAVDGSKAMLTAARRRLAEHGNVELRCGTLEALPLEDGELDAAVLSLVLHYVPEPAWRWRKYSGCCGRVVGWWWWTWCPMVARSTGSRWAMCGRVSPSRSCAAGWRSAGLSCVSWHALAPDPHAKGPLLFAASAA